MNGFISAWECSTSFQEFAMLLSIMVGIFAGIVAVVVLVINLLARRWLTSKQMGFLWGLVLLRLAMPFAPESVISFQTLFVPSEVEVQETIVVPGPYATVGSSNLESHQWPEGKIISKPVEATVPEVGMLESLSQSLFSVLEASLIGIINFRYSALIWLAVSMLILFRMLITHWRFTQQVKQTPVSEDDRLLSLWNSCCEQVGVRHKIPVILFDGVSQPSVMGAIRPRLLLPSDVAELKDEQLQLIMLHELAHIRRRDVAINWGLFTMRLLHWWNPIYWLAASRYCNLREQTCDAMVLRWMSSPSNKKTERDYCTEYSELLLSLAQRPSIASRWKVTLPVSILGFFSRSLRKRTVSNRLRALRRSTLKRHPVNTLIAVAAILLIAVCGLTNAKDPTVKALNEVAHISRSSDYFIKKYSALDSFDESQECLVCVYPIADLIMPTSEEDRAKADAAGIYIPPAIPLDTLMQDIEQIFILMLPPSWLEEELLEKHQIKKPSGQTSGDTAKQARIRLNDKTLSIVIRAPQAVIDEISQRLQTYRNSGRSLITVSCRMTMPETNVVDSLGIKWGEQASSALMCVNPEDELVKSFRELSAQPVPQLDEAVKSIPIHSAVLTKKQTRQFLISVQKDERSSILFAPIWTAINGQKVKVADIVHRPFVIGASWKSTGELKPEIKFVSEGTEITYRVTLEKDGATIHIQGFCNLSNIEDVRIFESTVKGSDSKVSIQIPRTEQYSIRFGADLKTSQSLLLDCYPIGKKKRRVCLLLTVNKVKEEAGKLNIIKKDTDK